MCSTSHRCLLPSPATWPSWSLDISIRWLAIPSEIPFCFGWYGEYMCFLSLAFYLHIDIVLHITRWWSQVCFISIPTWGNDPIWLIFFRWVETTNQIILCAYTSVLSWFTFYMIIYYSYIRIHQRTGIPEPLESRTAVFELVSTKVPWKTPRFNTDIYIYICIYEYDLWYMIYVLDLHIWFFNTILYTYNSCIVLFIHIFKLVNVSAAMLACLLANNCDVAFRCAELQSQMIHVWYIYLPGKPLRIQICPDRIREKSSIFLFLGWDFEAINLGC